MGCLCSKVPDEENEILMTTLLKKSKFDGLPIYFSTQTITTIQNQCLLIFTDSHARISKNVFLRKASKSIAQKIEEYFDVQLNGAQFKIGQCKIMDIQFPGLPFKKIAVLCLRVWGGSSHIENPIAQSVQNSLDEIRKINIQSLALTCVNEQLGIPIHIGEKCLIQAVYKKRSQFKNLTVLSNTVSDHNRIVLAFQRYRESVEVQSSGVKESSYF